MRNRLNDEDSPQFGDKYFGYCAHCACQFDYTRLQSKYCSDKCRWRYNGLKNKNAYFNKCYELGIPLSRQWLLWANDIVSLERSKEIYSNLKAFDLRNAHHVKALVAKLNYPQLLQLSEEYMRDAIELISERYEIFPD